MYLAERIYFIDSSVGTELKSSNIRIYPILLRVNPFLFTDTFQIVLKLNFMWILVSNKQPFLSQQREFKKYIKFRVDLVFPDSKRCIPPC